MFKYLFFLFIPTLFLTSCNDLTDFEASSKDSTGNFIGYKAKTTLSLSQIYNVSFDTLQPLKNIGKVISTEKILLIGELNKGIHVFDNRTPANPIKMFFIQIPANIDFIYRDNFIIADNGNDLISINVKVIDEVIDNKRNVSELKKLNLSSIFEVISRKEKLFRFPQFPSERNIFYECPDTTAGFVVEWEKTGLKTQPNCYR